MRENIRPTGENQQEKTPDSKESIPSLDRTVDELKDLESDTKTREHRDDAIDLRDDIMSQIDSSDGIDAQEQQWMYIVEDFFDNFLDDWEIDDVSEDTKKSLAQRIQNHGYTMANLDSLAKNLRAQDAQLEGKDPQEKKSIIERMLASAMGGHLLDQLEDPSSELLIHERMAMLAQVQIYEDMLDDEAKERKRKLRELLLAELFERKNLEIYEVVIDASGRVIITMQDPSGEKVTISYDPLTGDMGRVDAGSVDDIIPADQTKIAQVIEKIRDQQSLPYDPEDTGTLLQFVEGVL